MAKNKVKQVSVCVRVQDEKGHPSLKSRMRSRAPVTAAAAIFAALDAGKPCCCSSRVLLLMLLTRRVCSSVSSVSVDARRPASASAARFSLWRSFFLDLESLALAAAAAAAASAAPPGGARPSAAALALSRTAFFSRSDWNHVRAGLTRFDEGWKGDGMM